MSDTHPATDSVHPEPTDPPKATHQCGTCGKTYAHSASLWKHRISKHTDGYDCQLCQTRVAGRKALDAHLRSEHDVAKTVACNCCGWLFADRSVMMAHSKYLADNGEPGMSPALAKPIYATEGEPPKKPSFDVTVPLPLLTKPEDDATATHQHSVPTIADHIGAVELDQNQLLSLLMNSLLPNQPYVGEHETAGVEGAEKKPKLPRKRKLLMPKNLVQKVAKQAVDANEKENLPVDVSESFAGFEANACEESVPRKNKRKAFMPVQVKPEEPLSEQQREVLKEHFDQARKSVYRITQLVPTDMTPELAKVIAELVTTLH